MLFILMIFIYHYNVFGLKISNPCVPQTNTDEKNFKK